MIDKLDNELRFQQDAMSLRAERQQVLANNIANADTPNFRARISTSAPNWPAPCKSPTPRAAA